MDKKNATTQPGGEGVPATNAETHGAVEKTEAVDYTDLQSIGRFMEPKPEAVTPPTAKPETEEAPAEPTTPEEQEPEKESEAEPEKKAEPEEPGDPELEGLSDEQKERIQKRIGKEVRKRKELEEKQAVEKETLESELAELRQIADARDTARAGQQTGMHPLYFAESEEAINGYLEAVGAFEEWANKYKAEGYEGKDGEKSYTPEQIRDRLADVRDERARVVPEARQLLRQRQEMESLAGKAYPRLSERTSDEAKTMRSILKIAPHLRLLPDYKMRIGDMIAGEALRKSKSQPGKSKVIAPHLPGAPTTTSKPKSTPPPSPKGGTSVDVKKWGEQGFALDTLAQMMD